MNAALANPSSLEMVDPSGDMCQARTQNPNCTVCNMAIGCPKIPTSINKEQMCSQLVMLVPVCYAACLSTVMLCCKTCSNVPL